MHVISVLRSSMLMRGPLHSVVERLGEIADRGRAT
jgi:hypothetical protein